MKKTYITPQTLVTTVDTLHALLLAVSQSTVTGDNGGWAREENPGLDIWNPATDDNADQESQDWDIWGGNQPAGGSTNYWGQ